MTRLRAVMDDPAVTQVLALLDRDGEEARIVGGAVRNLLMDEPVGDFDIATTALPEEVVRRAGEAGIRSIPTGLAHGTVTLLVDGQAFEVTTLRRDTDTDGRHATVAFGRDWAEDALRRDFTFNALSLDRSGRVHDTVGGLDDLRARRVRFIGDAHQRIREDFLRSLRFFRFHASYGRGVPDDEGLAAVIAERDGLARLSRERIRAEVMKLLVAPGAADTLAVMAETGILNRILGGVPRLSRLRAMIALEEELTLAPDAIRRLAALNVAVVEDGGRLRDRLRLSNSEHAALNLLGDGIPAVRADIDERARRQLAYRLGDAFAPRVLAAWAAADVPGSQVWRSLWLFACGWQAPKLPWTGRDLTERGLQGKALGQALRDLETAWIEADFPLKQKYLDEITAKVIPPL